MNDDKHNAVERWLLVAIDAMGTASALLFASIGVLISYDVLMRSLFNAPTIWVLETVTYLMVSAVFIGGPYVLRKGEHIAIDIFTNLMPRGVAIQFHRFCLIITVGLFSIIVWQAFNMAMYSRFLGLASPTLYIPIWLIQATIPLGAAFIVLEGLRQVAASFRTSQR